MPLALLEVIFTLFRIVQFLVVGRVIASWLKADEKHVVVRVLREITEPLFKLVRPIASKIPGPLDWSPVILLLGLDAARWALGLLA